MRIKFILLITVFFLAGCWDKNNYNNLNPDNKITKEFLSSHGFVESEDGSDIYSLRNVRLGDISQELGFSLSDLQPTPSQQSFSDVRIVKIRDLYFVIRSEVRDQDGKILPNSLNNPDAICTVSVALDQVKNEAVRKNIEAPN